MALLKNIALMGTSTALRLACGLLTFVVMARLLGPDQFGVLMLWFSVTTLITLLANFGFTPYLLKELGANPASAVRVMSEVLTAKIMLSVFILIMTLPSIVWLDGPIIYVFYLLLAAQLADSMTEFFNVGFRATNRYATETQLASIAAIVQLVLVTVACYWQANPVAAAAALMLSRAVVLLITWRSQLRYFSQLHLTSWAIGWQKIKQTHTYASDFALQSLFGQVDSLVLNHFLGPASVGVYQAGMRLFNGGAQAASVLANVFLPRAAQCTGNEQQFAKESKSIQYVFIACGFGFGSLLVLASKPITLYLFGAKYMALAGILPWFGALFLVRFIASSWGIILTSIGEQGFRAKMNFLQWIVVFILAFFLVPKLQEPGWIISLAAGNTFLFFAYFIKTAVTVPGFWNRLWLPVAACVCFVPFLIVELT